MFKIVKLQSYCNNLIPRFLNQTDYFSIILPCFRLANLFGSKNMIPPCISTTGHLKMLCPTPHSSTSYTSTTTHTAFACPTPTLSHFCPYLYALVAQYI